MKSALATGLVVFCAFTASALDSIYKSGPERTNQTVGVETQAYQFQLAVPEEAMSKSLWHPDQGEPPVSPFQATKRAWEAVRKIALPGEQWKVEDLSLDSSRDPKTKHYKAFYYIRFSQWKNDYYWEIPFVVLMNGEVFSPVITRK